MNFDLSVRKYLLALGAAIGVAACLVAPVAADDTVELSDVSALPGETVEVTFTYTSDGVQHELEARARIQGMSNISAVDASNMCEGADADFDNCQLNDTNRLVFTATNFDPGTGYPPLDSFTGSILITIDAGASPGDVILLEWDAPDDVGLNFTPTNAIDGSITIIDTPPEELSELSVAPASIDFGLIDLGGMPVTDTITATNTGGASSSLNISAASISGDAEFTIVTNGCAGTDLAAGESCDVVVQFDAGADGVYAGSVDFTSDADSNPNASVSIAGEAGSAPDLSVTPAPGAINLGTGLQGTVLSSGGSFSNAGSAAGDVSCTVSGAEFSTVPSPIAGTIEPGGSLDFSVQCTLPADAEDGDTFGGSLVCSGDIDATWELSCGVSEWEPLPVPTMQKWGLLVLTLMMLMVGGLSIRFFRN